MLTKHIASSLVLRALHHRGSVTIDSHNIYYLDQLNRRDQNIDATSCGWWCIAYLYYMTNSKGSMLDRMKKFEKKFNKDTKQNEIDLKKYINKIYLNKK